MHNNKNNSYKLFSNLPLKLKSVFSKRSIIGTSSALIYISYYASAFANPEGGVVTSGAATITSPSSNVVRIQQGTDRAAIDWQSFNIAGHETVQFQQPSASAMILNRINPKQGVSEIYGSVQANGRIILSNPAGIWFGPAARVDVAGLIATTASISDASFMSGSLKFTQLSDWSNSTVINEGTLIASSHGLVALVGSNVSNTGDVEAHFGNIVVASGNAFTMHFANNELIGFTVDEKSLGTGVDHTGKPLRDHIKNTGKLLANGGHILVTAKTATTVLDHTINMQGIVEAKSVGVKNGEIVLNGEEGNVFVSSKLVASGAEQNTTGGTIKIFGNKIVIADNALLDVSGDVGGGNVFIGGNEYGLGKESNSDYVYVSPKALINASALLNGNGGKVVAWSNIKTFFYGTVLARGGNAQGNGGWVETSGKGYLDVNGAVIDTTAPFGKTGVWLLDPADIYIAKNQENATTAGMIGTDASANTEGLWSSFWNYVWGSPKTFSASMLVDDSLLTTENLVAALETSNVIVTTSNWFGRGDGNITIVDGFGWKSGNSLTLTAAKNIYINGAVQTGNVGSMLILNADGTVHQTAVISGAGGVMQQGAGVAILSQNNSYTGDTIINTGTVVVTNKNGLGESGSVVLQPGALLKRDYSADPVQVYNTTTDANVIPIVNNTGNNISVDVNPLTVTNTITTSANNPTASVLAASMLDASQPSAGVIFPEHENSKKVNHHTGYINNLVNGYDSMHATLENNHFMHDLENDLMHTPIHLLPNNLSVQKYESEIAELIDTDKVHHHHLREVIKKSYFSAVEVISPEQRQMLDSVITDINANSPLFEKIEAVDADIIS